MARSDPTPPVEDRWERFIRGLREGDALVTREFCDRYGAALERLAAKHLQPRLRRRVDPEDVVQSAFRTFLRRTAGGQFRLDDSEGLWRLLCSITLTKVREQARYQLRQRRSPTREVPIDSGSDESDARSESVAGGPSPSEAAEFAEEFQKLLEALDDEEQRIVELKLRDYTNDEVAESLGCSERTVRRLLARLRVRLSA